MIVLAEWLLPTLISTQKSFVVFFLPNPGEEGRNREAWVGTCVQPGSTPNNWICLSRWSEALSPLTGNSDKLDQYLPGAGICISAGTVSPLVPSWDEKIVVNLQLLVIYIDSYLLLSVTVLLCSHDFVPKFILFPKLLCDSGLNNLPVLMLNEKINNRSKF